MSTTLHNRLDDARANINDLREQRAALRAKHEDAKRAMVAAAQGKDPQAGVSTPEFATYTALGLELGQIEERLSQWTDAEHDVLAIMGGRAGSRLGTPDYNALADPGVVAALQRFAENPDVRIGPPHDLGSLMSAEAMAASFGTQLLAAGITDTGAPTLRQGPNIGIVPALRANPRLIDVLPAVPAPSADRTYTFSTESTAASGSMDTAGETAEGDLSPEANLVLEDVTVTYRTIRHYIKCTREQLADIEGLQARLQTRLIAGLWDRLEDQVINGNGTGENIRGIEQFSGVGDVPFAGGTLLTDLIRDGIAEVEGVGAVPANFVAISVGDDATIDKSKTSGSGEYLSAPFLGGPGTLWSRARVVVPRLASGKALVGATVVDGVPTARIVIREGVNVLISDSDQDDFLRRRVTLHAACRVALEVATPAAYAVVHTA